MFNPIFFIFEWTAAISYQRVSIYDFGHRGWKLSFWSQISQSVLFLNFTIPRKTNSVFTSWSLCTVWFIAAVDGSGSEDPGWHYWKGKEGKSQCFRYHQKMLMHLSSNAITWKSLRFLLGGFYFPYLEMASVMEEYGLASHYPLCPSLGPWQS